VGKAGPSGFIGWGLRDGMVVGRPERGAMGNLGEKALAYGCGNRGFGFSIINHQATGLTDYLLCDYCCEVCHINPIICRHGTMGFSVSK